MSTAKTKTPKQSKKRRQKKPKKPRAKKSKKKVPARPKKHSAKKAKKPRAKKASRARAKKPKKPTRAERAKMLRERILQAAEKVVGEMGYKKASIGRIAIEADVAQGTIYLYFETRQHLFDELLPHAGLKFMTHIGDAIRGATSFREVEERATTAFFEYLRENPGYYRVLNEAEFAAPTGHRKHFQDLIDHYIASMKRSVRDGTLPPNLSDTELEVAAYTMMASRSFLYRAYVKYGKFDTPPKAVIDAYLDCQYLTRN